MALEGMRKVTRLNMSEMEDKFRELQLRIADWLSTPNGQSSLARLMRQNEMANALDKENRALLNNLMSKPIDGD